LLTSMRPQGEVLETQVWAPESANFDSYAPLPGELPPMQALPGLETVDPGEELEQVLRDQFGQPVEESHPLDVVAAISRYQDVAL